MSTSDWAMLFKSFRPSLLMLFMPSWTELILSLSIATFFNVFIETIYNHRCIKVKPFIIKILHFKDIAILLSPMMMFVKL